MSVETYAPPVAGTQLDTDEIELLNQEFAELTPAERIAEARDRFAGGLVVASSFGPTAPLLLKLVADEAPDTPVTSIRHHHETLRTLELVDWYRRELDLDVRTYDAPPLPIPLEGSPAFAEFQHLIKVEPFQQMLDDLQPQAYLSGVMRWQSMARPDLPFMQDKGAVLAINPVVDVTESEVEEFFDETGWPRDDKYSDPAKGRNQNLECGLNTTQYRAPEELLCQNK